MPRAPLALLLVVASLSPAAGRAGEPPGLSVDVPATAAVAGGALALWGASALAEDRLVPPACRWCEPPGLDRAARDALRWSDPHAAAVLSDGLVVALPASLALADWLMAGRDLRRAGEGVLVVVEAAALAEVATQALKYATARRRPYAWAAGARAAPDDDLSFASGHAAGAFAVAGAFGTVARLRGYAGWPAVYGGGFAAAAAVAWLRMGADKHWLTDVGAGAALGAACGVALPLLLHRGDGPPRPGAIAVTPLPLGVAGTF